MTPKMQRILKSLKSLSAYEVASLEAINEGTGTALMRVIIGLDVSLASVQAGMIYGLTPQEFETAKERKIMAIKMVRERTTMGLADAKKMVEDAMNRATLKDFAKTNIGG